MKIHRRNKRDLDMYSSIHDLYTGFVHVSMGPSKIEFMRFVDARGYLDLRHAKVFQRWLGERIAEAEGKTA